MIGNRTRYSLAQLLEQQDPSVVVAMIAKHGARISLGHRTLLSDLINILRDLEERTVMEVLAEVVRTSNDLRFRITPKGRFDGRMLDLTTCLALDGYQVDQKRLLQIDPSIADAAPIDDDLIEALQNSRAPRRIEIIQKINDSADAFRSAPPDYNASLINARVALETLAGDVALDVASGAEDKFDASKWGDILRFLRVEGEITIEEEQGLAGVFRFLSPGAHRPVGIPEVQMARLGRSFALNMCWFLLKNRLARKGG